MIWLGEKTHTCQSIDPYESSTTGNADKMAVIVGNHGRKEGLVGLRRETENK